MPIQNFKSLAVSKAKKNALKILEAGLSEADIDAFANDPEELEEKVLEYTEAERGMIAGLPEEALVNVQLAALLEGMEAGDIPVFARPAVAAVNQMMAARGLSASTVGRDNLFNAIIAAAYPIDTNYLYFVADNKGRHIFNKTFKGHLKSKN